MSAMCSSVLRETRLWLLVPLWMHSGMWQTWRLALYLSWVRLCAAADAATISVWSHMPWPVCCWEADVVRPTLSGVDAEQTAFDRVTSQVTVSEPCTLHCVMQSASLPRPSIHGIRTSATRQEHVVHNSGTSSVAFPAAGASMKVHCTAVDSAGNWADVASSHAFTVGTCWWCGVRAAVAGLNRMAPRQMLCHLPLGSWQLSKCGWKWSCRWL